MPETRGGTAGSPNVFYAFGEEAGIGFSPFAIDELDSDPDGAMAASFGELASLAPLLLAHQSVGDVHGFVLDKDQPSVDFTMSGYTVHVSLDRIFGSHVGFRLWPHHGHRPRRVSRRRQRLPRFLYPALSSGPQVGIASVDEGKFVDGQWIPGRRLNGDEDDQGQYWRFDPRHISTEKLKLYRFE